MRASRDDSLDCEDPGGEVKLLVASAGQVVAGGGRAPANFGRKHTGGKPSLVWLAEKGKSGARRGKKEGRLGFGRGIKGEGR
jgi:hypothetical protein